MDPITAAISAALTTAVLGVTNDWITRIGYEMRGHEERGRFVQDIADGAFAASGGRFHVLVFNAGMPHTNSLDLVSETTADYYGLRLRVCVIRGGMFINHGDGGYINWCFISPGGADHRRSGDGGRTVVFSPIG